MSLSQLSPWHSKPLSDAAKEAKFRAVMDLNADRALLGRSAVVAGWLLGAFGGGCLVVTAATVAVVFPLKQTEVRFFVADSSTGIISQPVSVADAPRTFNAATDRQYLRRYLEAREAWVWETDRERDHLAKVMSTPDEQARIEAARKKPDYVGRVLGKDGHIELGNFHYHERPGGRDGTRSYFVQYVATVWHGTTPDKPVPHTAAVDFQWHPDLPMLPADRDDNPGGFQAIAYSSNADTPDTKRQ